LRTLLELDREPDRDSATENVQEQLLRGVRKAQAKLATFYLSANTESHARAIFRDMEKERPERLRSIYLELQRVESKDFWEVIDRGTNFDYLDAERKRKLKQFFSWFHGLITEATG
jgi:hypothetical protein